MPREAFGKAEQPEPSCLRLHQHTYLAHTLILEMCVQGSNAREQRWSIRGLHFGRMLLFGSCTLSGDILDDSSLQYHVAKPVEMTILIAHCTWTFSR